MARRRTSSSQMLSGRGHLVKTHHVPMDDRGFAHFTRFIFYRRKSLLGRAPNPLKLFRFLRDGSHSFTCNILALLETERAGTALDKLPERMQGLTRLSCSPRILVSLLCQTLPFLLGKAASDKRPFCQPFRESGSRSKARPLV